VSRLAAGLSEALSHHVGINLYFTPPRSQGFAPHADGHDVFILQLSGMKKWRIFQPLLRLPLEDQQVKVDRKHLPRRKLDARLQPGNILYIPRGFVHEAVAGNAASSHLTIGIHSLRWADLARHALAVAAERDVTLRESVSLRDLAGGRCSKELILRIRRLSAMLTDSEVAAMAGERARGQIVRMSKPVPDGHFGAIDRARSLNLQSTVQRRLGLICRVWCDGRRAFIGFGVNQVDGPAGIEEALRFVASSYRFKVKEMPDVLTNQSKLLLTRRLITEGLLTIP
jgi:hypothetical protein